MISLIPEILPCKDISLPRLAICSPTPIRPSVSDCDISHSLARHSAPSVVQPFVVESRNGQRELLLCVYVGVRNCEWGSADGLCVGGVEDRTWGDEGRV